MASSRQIHVLAELAYGIYKIFALYCKYFCPATGIKVHFSIHKEISIYMFSMKHM